MRTLWAASFRHLLHHPAQLTLALVGLALGVATIVAVDIATSISQRAFELSMQAVNGSATHQIVGGPDGIDERLYVELQRAGMPGVLEPPAFAPVVEGYASVGDQDLQLLGLDPLAAADVNGRQGVPGGAGAPTTTDVVGPAEALKVPDADLRRWFTRRGTVVLAAETAKQLGIHDNDSFSVDIGGRY